MREDWVEVELGEVCEIVSGKNQKQVENPDGKYPIYGSGGIFGYADEYLCEPGTTIIGRKGTINSPIYVSERFWNVDTAFGISPKCFLDSMFNFYFCMGFNFKKLDKSTTIPSLAKRDILKINYSFPPLPIQRAIVAKIEGLFSDLDNGIADLKKAQEQLKIYRQAVLKKAFEGELTKEWREKQTNLPEKWEWVKSGDLFSFVTSGSRGWSKYYSDEGSLFIRVTNLNFNTLDLDLRPSKNQYVKLPYNKTEGLRTKVYEGDFLFSITGYLGMFAIAPKLEDAYVNQHVSLCRPKDGFDKKYFGYWIVSESGGIKHFNLKNKGAVKAGLNLDDLKTIPVPLPSSIQEQHQIVREIESRLSVCDKVEQNITKALDKAEALRQSILKKAFEGELLTKAEIARCKQEADYEPASVLLERIQKEKTCAK
ncbi:MAG: restriction endonuclease subunit S [Spirochaetales bacterium]|nr:restriction endonuclease subunit S [Spirochaetales bacterium]